MLQRQSNSATHLLDIEAADYFRLDPAQVNMFHPRSSCYEHQQHHHHHHHQRQKYQSTVGLRKTRAMNGQQQSFLARYPNDYAAAPTVQQQRVHRYHQQPYQGSNTLNLSANSNLANKSGQLAGESREKPSRAAQSPYFSPSSNQLDSSTTSTTTNSLPSISSSPSVSPSLVCPHLSLDDILSLRNTSKSPHTIGLCEKCRLDPPPGIQSPLSPLFRPSQNSQEPSIGEDDNSIYEKRFEAEKKRNLSYIRSPSIATNERAIELSKAMKRGYSDHHVSNYSIRSHRKDSSSLVKSVSNLRIRDDSLDYYLEPYELRRLQMSPTLRNSVEFIQKNPVEAGRVLKIYKNGQPFDKPLRICITRGEFATLNNLLDYINSRQLIILGARYLFHLDGQLVYSVNELKHGSAYIVSGTRNFDLRANSIIKEQHFKEVQQIQYQEMLARRQIKPSNQRSPIKSTISIKSSRPPAAMTTKLASRASTTSNKQQKLGKKVLTTRHYNRPLDTSNESIGADQKFIDSTSISKSNENLVLVDKISQERPVKIIRAKSELSALPTKRKKNVTFVDTGRGSSPAINEKLAISVSDDFDTIVDDSYNNSLSNDRMHSIDLETERALRTNEIGIQVSDSIEGFLIDLPMAMPSTSDKSSLTTGNKTFLRKGQGSQASQLRGIRKNSFTSPSKKVSKLTNNANRMGGKEKRQIVTIQEKQLSLDELNELRDLDHGEHHSKALRKAQQHVTIKLESVDASTETINGSIENLSETNVHKQKKKNILADEEKSKNVVVAVVEKPELNEEDGSSLITRTKDDTQMDGESNIGNDRSSETIHWRYPGGREASTTPTERPVSQSEANDVVHATVTTPTPSLSTVGDNNSLSMSYETPAAPTGASSSSILSQAADQSDTQHKITAKEPPKSIVKLPVKQRVSVLGHLRNGIYPPTKNFRLTWVNGITINDRYPDNSSSLVTAAAAAAAQDPTISKNSSDSSLLSPKSAANQKNISNQFKLSERFNNWICHSKRHDELIYPAGCLIVLWCRWTNEQRYYSRHKSNVSTVTLASLDLDLAASAQFCDSVEKISASIHLWSLTTLDTLQIIDDDQFCSKRIFSLKVKNTTSEGCELSVAAKDGKRLWIYTIYTKLNVTESNDTNKQLVSSSAKSNTIPKKQTNSNSKVTVIKVNRPLQPNQEPLLMMRMSNVGDQQQIPTIDSKKSSKGQLDGSMLSFGRRHFQVWTTDRKQQKLNLLQADNKSPVFADIIGKANCLVRMSPNEYLIGDAEGTITLIMLNCKQTVTSEKRKKKLFGPTENKGFDYTIETVNLLKSETQSTNSMNSKFLSITCLTRITGNLFVSADATCTIRFWKITRTTKSNLDSENKEATTNNAGISCRQMSSINLPRDLGFICAIILSKYNRKQSMVEFYVASTSNAILFGSVQFENTPTTNITDEGNPSILANSSLSVVYEGHETSALNLVADFTPKNRQQLKSGVIDQQDFNYFTCSLDCKICKWNGKKLIWKSMLPSACASLAVHPVGFVLAIGSADGTVYILDKISGLLISYFPLTPVCINCLAYSRDGTLLAAGCANGSIFILPVYERGLKYKKVSIFQSPYPVVSLQFSVDNQYILTSVTHGSYQELILWDLPNFRYMRDNVKTTADKIEWFDSICSGSEDVRAIWENANLVSTQSSELMPKARQMMGKRLSLASTSSFTDSTSFVVNLSCHRSVQSKQQLTGEPSKENFVIASDTHGYLRLFRYPCYDIQQGFYEARVTSSAVNCCRFLSGPMFVSSSIDGLIFLWVLE